MANIQLAGVYRLMQSRFNTEGTGSTRFEDDFINATNLATRRINRDATLATRIELIANTDDEVALSDEYLDVLCEIIAFFLIGLGQRPARGDEAVIPKESEITLKAYAIGRDIRQQAQEADTDDESDFTALGALGG